MFIGAFRPTEKSGALTKFIDYLISKEEVIFIYLLSSFPSQLNIIQLEPLAVNDVSLMLQEMFHENEDKSNELAQWVCSKTGVRITDPYFSSTTGHTIWYCFIP